MFDPTQPTLRRRLASGDSVGVIWLALGSPALAEMAARSNPDAIVLDLQHGLWDRASVEAAIGAIPSRIPVLVRVAENSPRAISEALDAGAEGVVVPLVESASEAMAAVSASRYPPEGLRSSGGVRPLADFAAYVEGARRGIVVCVMIETAEGVRNAREIVGVEGIDLIFIGTGDLALSLGAFPKPDQRLDAACASVCEACKAAEVPCGIFTTSVEAARARRADGYRMTVTANDIQLVAMGFAAASAGFGPAPDARAQKQEAKAPRRSAPPPRNKGKKKS
ncbi:MAG: hypothetical protein KIT16_15975 [Rhodospirillaceae bacterium]|nr:hypothetical protein [Rhodospirillaceae bacterium]